MEFWRDCSNMSLMVSSPSLARSLPDFELQAVTSFTSHQLKSCKMLHINDCLCTEHADPHGSSQPYMPLVSTHQEHALVFKASSLGNLTPCRMPWEPCASTRALSRTCAGEPRIYKGHCKCPSIYQESLRRNKSYMEKSKTNLGEVEAALWADVSKQHALDLVVEALEIKTALIHGSGITLSLYLCIKYRVAATSCLVIAFSVHTTDF